MASTLQFSYELIDNKIPCGGFNLLGGGVKGKNFVSNSVENLIFQSFSPEQGVEATEAKFLLMLNFEDTAKIAPFIEDPSSIPNPSNVATNLRFTCINYYDYLKIANGVTLIKLSDEKEGASILKNVLNGSVVSLVDVMNLYTQRLGLKTVQGYQSTPFQKEANSCLSNFYGADKTEKVFETWVSMNIVWTWFMDKTYYRTNNILSDSFKNFQLSFNANGNVLRYFN